MPIPKLSGDLSRQQIVDAYAVYGWQKRIKFDWIEVDQRNGGYLKKAFEANSDAMPCSIGEDASDQLSFVQFVPTGIVWTCANCKRTEGPLSFEASGIRLLDQKSITLNEAWETINRTNQKKPIGMPALSGKGGFRLKQ
jgi:hypothetical protein